MTADDLIKAYVAEVMRHLPRGQRDDVGFELQELLRDQLADRAGSGEDMDAAGVLAMLDRMGAPEEVAARYREPGVTIVEPHRTRWFLTLALAGVALQWALTLPRALAAGTPAQWWADSGLGALWWPGFLVLAFAAAAHLRTRRGSPPQPWRPAAVDVLPVDRGRATGAFVAMVLGMAVLLAMPAWSRALPAPAAAAFALDPGFVAGRAPLALLLWAGQLGLAAILLCTGRWTARLRGVRHALDLGWLATLALWIAGGPIFSAGPTDSLVKALLVLLCAAIAVGLIMTLLRGRRRAPNAPLIA